MISPVLCEDLKYLFLSWPQSLAAWTRALQLGCKPSSSLLRTQWERQGAGSAVQQETSQDDQHSTVTDQIRSMINYHFHTSIIQKYQVHVRLGSEDYALLISSF